MRGKIFLFVFFAVVFCGGIETSFAASSDWAKCGAVAEKVANAVGGTVQPPNKDGGSLIGLIVRVGKPPLDSKSFHLSVGCGAVLYQPKQVSVHVSWSGQAPPEAFWVIAGVAAAAITREPSNVAEGAVKQCANKTLKHSGGGSAQLDVGNVHVECVSSIAFGEEGHDISIFAIGGYSE